ARDGECRMAGVAERHGVADHPTRAKWRPQSRSHAIQPDRDRWAPRGSREHRRKRKNVALVEQLIHRRSKLMAAVLATHIQERPMALSCQLVQQDIELSTGARDPRIFMAD